MRERRDEVEERLIDFERVFIGRSRAPGAPLFEGTLELGEQAEVRARVEIAVQQVALKDVTVRVLNTSAPQRIVEVLVSQARIGAERHVDRSLTIERDVLDRVPDVRPTRGVS